MSVANAIEDLKARVSGAYDTLKAKGATIPAEKTTANLPTAIGTIPDGGYFVRLDTDGSSDGNDTTVAVAFADKKQTFFLRSHDDRIYQVPSPTSPDISLLESFQECLHGVKTMTTLNGEGFIVDGKLYRQGQSYNFQKHDETVRLRCYTYCLKWGTKVSMADGSTKNVEELALGDLVRSIDPETGEMAADEVTYVDGKAEHSWCIWDEWRFADGTVLETVNRHRFYNAERKAMVYLDEWRIGDHAVREDGTLTELVAHASHKEEARHATLFTSKWNNYFAGGLLSGNRHSSPLDIGGLDR